MQNFNLLINFHLDNQSQGPGGEREIIKAIELARLNKSHNLKMVAGLMKASPVLHIKPWELQSIRSENFP